MEKINRNVLETRADFRLAYKIDELVERIWTITETEAPAKKKYYAVDVVCDNCGRLQALKIPWGTSVEKYLKRPKDCICPHCECLMRKR